jgi:hypothetical protein
MDLPSSLTTMAPIWSACSRTDNSRADAWGLIVLTSELFVWMMSDTFMIVSSLE